MAADIL